jgi:hypothetical protein
MIKIYHKHKPVLLITILTLFIFNASLSFAGQYKATRVTDGDTIQVIADGTKKPSALLASMPQKSHTPRISRGNHSAKRLQNTLQG